MAQADSTPTAVRYLVTDADTERSTNQMVKTLAEHAL